MKKESRENKAIILEMPQKTKGVDTIFRFSKAIKGEIQLGKLKVSNGFAIKNIIIIWEVYGDQ